ncbi:hypothetical protein [Amycolatopsis sp. RTGN1]|uniref:hypothetical protein n=1 Tax=Amycolatopsis ponsaeliensis TaxID=2992142 RepID=UPI002551C0AB|nr:hypothetical protein [Amycolatopsis sp. RTGN1]
MTRIGLLYPTRDCGEDDFTALCDQLGVDLDFAYVEWNPGIGPSRPSTTRT